MADKWYSDPQTVANLGEALVNADVLTEQADFTAYLKKPMAFDDHFDAWKDAGYPTSDDDDGWDNFLEAVNNSDDSDDDDGDES